LNHQSKKKKCGGKGKENLSAFTKLLGAVGRVREGNRSDLDSHAYCCVCEKEVLTSMILTVTSPSLVGIQKEKHSHCGLYQQLWVT
jgi:hypothetical protein